MDAHLLVELSHYSVLCEMMINKMSLNNLMAFCQVVKFCSIDTSTSCHIALQAKPMMEHF